MPFPEFDPVAFAIGPLVVRWYALAYIVGLLGGWAYARRLAANSSLWGAQKQPSPEDLDDLLVYAALGVVLGGRLGYVLFYNPVFYLQNPLDALKIRQGGRAFHGGRAGAAAGIALLARRRGLNPLAMFDVAAPVAPIGIFLGRIANFINGELWGRASDLPWAVIFPRGGPEPRHPSQLYEAALEGLVLFFVLAWRGATASTVRVASPESSAWAMARRGFSLNSSGSRTVSSATCSEGS